MLYVQHLLGIGHLMRARRIALALHRNGFLVTLVSGGLPVAGFESSGVEQIALPAMAVRDGRFGELVDIDGKCVDDGFKAHRCQQLLNAYESIEPDIVMLEAFPFGRRQLRFELLPLIEAIQLSVPKPVLVTSIRDVLQRNRKAGRDEETAYLVKRYFDKVLVHGDPKFATLDETYPLAGDIADKIAYTGLVCGPPPESAAEKFDVVVSAGGGAVGATLLRAVTQAALVLPEIASWCVIAGPYLPENEFSAIKKNASSKVTVERFRHDFTGLLATTRLSVSQAGYNTVSDVLQAGCRALLIPFSSHGETEQADRAARLERLGLATVLPDDVLSDEPLGEKFATAIHRALSQDPPPMAPAINTSGADGTANHLRTLLNS
jgi:predicted glycosyltransferase